MTHIDNEANRNKRQHFVPQFYLRLFGNNKQKVDVVLKNGEFHNNSIVSVASRKYFYDSHLDKIIEGHGKRAVENILGVGEGIYAALFKRILLNLMIKRVFSVHDKKLFAQYLYFQFVRTNFMRTELKDSKFSKPFNNDEKIAQIFAIFGTHSDNNSFVDQLLSKSWQILENQLNYDLPTSDNPLVFTGDESLLSDFFAKGKSGGLISNALSVIYFPLSPRYLLKIYDLSENALDIVGYEKLEWEEFKDYCASLSIQSETQVYCYPGGHTTTLMQRLALVFDSHKDEIATACAET